MINVENGELSVKGNASTLFAELTGAFKGITEGMLEDGYPKEMVERNVKGFMFLAQDICGELGIDTNLSDEDRENFERAKNVQPKEVAEKLSKALTDLLDPLKSATDEEDDTDDDDTEDDIPDFLF